MTVRMSLASRLKLARVACEVRVPHGGPGLISVARAGAELLLVREQLDADALLTLMRSLPAVVGTADPHLARELCVFEVGDPALETFSRRQPWGLKGLEVYEDQDLLALPGGADFLVLRSPELVGIAAETQPPLTPSAIPWFVAGAFDAGVVESLVAHGARRVWLTGEVSPEQVRAVDEVLRRAWHADPAVDAYRRVALLS